jgi:hypothetical protein
MTIQQYNPMHPGAFIKRVYSIEHYNKCAR